MNAGKCRLNPAAVGKHYNSTAEYKDYGNFWQSSVDTYKCAAHLPHACCHSAWVRVISELAPALRLKCHVVFLA